MDQNTARLYKLVNSCDDHYYIGSTKCTLKKRFAEHKYAAKTKCIKAYQHFNSIGWDKVTIKLIEEFTYTNIQEVLQKEAQHLNEAIHDPLCLNVILPYLTQDEKLRRKEEHNQEIREKMQKIAAERNAQREDERRYNMFTRNFNGNTYSFIKSDSGGKHIPVKIKQDI